MAGVPASAFEFLLWSGDASLIAFLVIVTTGRPDSVIEQEAFPFFHPG
jgi:hypothetical protein